MAAAGRAVAQRGVVVVVVVGQRQQEPRARQRAAPRGAGKGAATATAAAAAAGAARVQRRGQLVGHQEVVRRLRRAAAAREHGVGVKVARGRRRRRAAGRLPRGARGRCRVGRGGRHGRSDLHQGEGSRAGRGGWVGGCGAPHAVWALHPRRLPPPRRRAAAPAPRPRVLFRCRQHTVPAARGGEGRRAAAGGCRGARTPVSDRWCCRPSTPLTARSGNR